MIKNVILSLSLGTSDDPTIDYAVSLARTFDARLVGIALAYEDVPMVLGDGISGQWVGGIDELRREIGAAVKAATGKIRRAGAQRRNSPPNRARFIRPFWKPARRSVAWRGASISRWCDRPSRKPEDPTI